MLSYYSSVLFNFLCVLILFQNTCSHVPLFQIRTLAVSFVSVQNTCNHLCFRSKHLQSALFEIRTLAITFVSDQNICSQLCFRSEHLQSPLFQILFQNTYSQICFRPCCRPLDFAAPGLLYARRNIDNYT